MARYMMGGGTAASGAPKTACQGAARVAGSLPGCGRDRA